MKKNKIIGITFGSFDLCHYGHALMFEECKESCDYLIVGVQSEPSIDRPEKNKPVQSHEERIGIVSSLKFVDEVISYKEKRDSLDQRWVKLLMQLNLLPIILPNNLNYVKKIIKDQHVKGILLTGGNNIFKYGGTSLERDEVDNFLIDQAIKKNIPLLGICRG